MYRARILRDRYVENNRIDFGDGVEKYHESFEGLYDDTMQLCGVIQ